MTATTNPNPATKIVPLKRRWVYAIDPGTTMSGWCIYDPNARTVQRSGADPNDAVIGGIWHGQVDQATAPVVAIESMANMGMEIGQSTLDATVWIGRFIEAADGIIGEPGRDRARAVLIPRRDVKLAMCGSSRAKDKNIRQAIIDSFGGDAVAIGGKKCPTCKGKGWAGRGRPKCEACAGTGWLHEPGPLHGVSGHAWSALAVALTYARTTFGRCAETA